MRGFTLGEVARVSGVHFRTVDLWSYRGFVRASITEAAGKGTTRLYGFADLVVLRIARKVRHFGVSPQALRKIQIFLRTYPHLSHPLANHRLVVVPDEGRKVARVEIATSQAALESLLRPRGQHIAAAVVLDLADAVADVKAGIAKLDAKCSRKRVTRKRRARRNSSEGSAMVAASGSVTSPQEHLSAGAAMT